MGGNLQSLLFKSHTGKKWLYNIITRKISLAQEHKCTNAEENTFFSDFKKQNYTKFCNSILQEAEILILNLTEECNFRCQYCIFSGVYKNQRRHSMKYMNIDVAKKAIDDHIQRSIKTIATGNKISINFYGGEPLLAFDLMKEILYYIHEQKFKDYSSNIVHSLTTNGYLLNNEKVDFLKKYNCLIYVTIDGPEDIHDNYRRTVNNHGTYEQIINNLNNIKLNNNDFYKKIGFICTLAPPENLIKRMDFFNSNPLFKGQTLLLTSINPYNMHHSFFTNVSEQNNNDIFLLSNNFVNKAKNDQFNDAIFERAFFSIPLGKLHMAQKQTGTRFLRPNGTCNAGQKRTFVSIDGNYYPCEKIGQLSGFEIGNINDGINLKKSWQIYNDYLKISKEDCLKCHFGNLCDFCYAVAIDKDYMSLEVKRKQCLNKVGYMKIMMQTYTTFIEEIPKKKWPLWLNTSSSDLI